MKPIIDWKNYKERHRFYNCKEWHNLRTYILQNEPLCRHCKENDIITPATECDHIIDIDEAPHLRLKFDNIQPLCKECHSKKTFNKILHNRDKLKLNTRTKWNVNQS